MLHILSFLALFVAFSVIPGFFVVRMLFSDREELSTIHSIFLGLAFSPLLLISISVTENLLGIPQSPIALLFNFVILALAAFYSLKKKSIPLFPSPIQDTLPNDTFIKKIVRFAPILFVAILAARVVPTFFIPTPITADPIAHAEWLRTLAKTGNITQEEWYPQGVAYFLNYFATFSNLSTPKIVLIFTNFFAGLFPIAIFYLALLFDRQTDRRDRTIFAILAFVIATLAPYPKELYYTSGKNAFIFALAAFPTLILAGNLLTKSPKKSILIAFLSFALFAVHFPTGLFAYLFLAIIASKSIVSFSSSRKPIINRKTLGNAFVFAFITLALLVLLARHVIPIYQSHPPAEDKTMSSSAQTITAPFQWLSTAVWQSQQDIFAHKPCFTVKFITGENLCKSVNLDKDEFEIAFFWLFIIALPILPFLRKASLVPQITLGYIFGFILTWQLLRINVVNGFFVFAEYSLLFTFLFILVIAQSITFLSIRISEKLPRFPMIVCVTLLAIAIIDNARAVEIYFDKQSKVSVKDQDLAAFDFIQKLDLDDKSILIELYNVNNQIIAGADSGIWIPSFTGKPVEVDWLRFSSDRSFEIYRLFKMLVENPADSDALDKLVCEYRIGYVFHGSANQRKSNIIKAQDFPELYELVYQNGAQLFRIRERKCK